MADVPELFINGPRDVVELLRACGITDEPTEILLGLALAEAEPRAHVVCGAAVRSGGGAAHPIDARQVADLAAELVVGAVVLVTVAPGSPSAPPRRAVSAFVALRRACADEDVALLDWIVVASRHWWSMRERVLHEAA